MPSSEFLLGKSQAAFNASGNLVYADKVVELEEIFREFLLFTDLITKLLSDRSVTKKGKKFAWQTQEA